MKILLLIVLYFCVFVSGQGDEKPGIIAKMNPKGFDLLNDIFSNILIANLKFTKFENFSGDIIGNNFILSDMKIYSAGSWTTNLRVSEPKTVEYKIANSNLIMTTYWEFTFIKTKYSGRVFITGTNVNIRSVINIGRDTSGKPTFRSGDCEAEIEKLKLKFHNTKFLLLLNSLSNLFSKAIKKVVEKEICSFVEKFVTKNGKNLTNEFQNSYPFLFGTFINLDLMRDPTVFDKSFFAAVRGRCFNKQNSSLKLNFFAPQLPRFSSTTKMSQSLISQYVMNTLLHALWQDGRLDASFGLEELIRRLPINQSTITRGSNNEAVSTLFGFLQATSSSVQVVVRAPAAPSGVFTRDGFSLNGSFIIGVNTSQDGALTELLSVKFIGGIIGRAFVREGATFAAIIKNVTIEAVSASGVPDDVINIINQSLHSVISNVIQPTIAGVAGSGYHLPELFNFTAFNISMEHKQNAVEIAFDFKPV